MQRKTHASALDSTPSAVLADSLAAIGRHGSEKPLDGPSSQLSIQYPEQAWQTPLRPAGIPDPKDCGNKVEQLLHTAQIRGN